MSIHNKVQFVTFFFYLLFAHLSWSGRLFTLWVDVLRCACRYVAFTREPFCPNRHRCRLLPTGLSDSHWKPMFSSRRLMADMMMMIVGYQFILLKTWLRNKVVIGKQIKLSVCSDVSLSHNWLVIRLFSKKIKQNSGQELVTDKDWINFFVDK